MAMSRKSRRLLPGRLFALGAVLFLVGFGLLQYLTSIGSDPAPGRVLFWCGLLLLIVGGGLWLTQPPARRRREHEEMEPDREVTPLENDDDDDLIPCPYCRRPIYEDSERCPECGKYLSREDAPLMLPTWVVVGVVLALMVTMLWVVFWP